VNSQPLDGDWQFSKAGEGNWRNASVPGCIHTDLMAVGAIPDPFYGDNEARVAWVAETDWIYRRVFVPDAQLMSHERIYLECDGLDTVAAIRLNGAHLARTANMFRRYRFDVTGIIKSGENTIEVEFESPVMNAREKLGSIGSVISPGDSIPGSPYLRKSMCQWGWDWGPKLPTSGIWRSICLAGYSTARIDDVKTSQRHADGVVELSVRVRAEFCGTNEVAVRATLTAPSGDVVTSDCFVKPDSLECELSLTVENPQLWWPNAYGEQPLYGLEVSLITPDGDPTPFDSRTMRLGLRTLELVQDADQWGKTFYFRVNGVAIFCKGGNWIPADQFPSRITREQYRDLIECAAQSNMNMLRIWGGGIYEDDAFFEFCDEYGILIWHDFMFSCAHYPVDQPMLDNIRAEAIDNVRRIRHHPCLALWCGNNEMECGVANWWNDEFKELREREYNILFHELLPEVCAAEDPATSYWPSSPSSNTPFVDSNGQSQGDSHYWDVWSGMLPFTEYRKRTDRFMSEFGFQAMPTMPTIESFATEDQRNLSSYIMDCHQKQASGNIRIVHYFAATYRFPSDFKSMVYLSHVQQAEAIRYGVEHWRRNRNEHHCMGTIFWQFNDCWPVTSWSSIDYNHRWKALNYAATRFYAPILLSAEESETGTCLHVTNDTLQEFRGTVKWSLETLTGAVVRSGEVEAVVPRESSFCIAKLDFADCLDIDTKRHIVLVYELRDGGGRVSIGLVAFVPSKYLELPVAPIQVKTFVHDDYLSVHLYSKSTARFVTVEAEGFDMRFSDNFFDLPAHRGNMVGAYVPDGADPAEVAARITVTSLRDTY